MGSAGALSVLPYQALCDAGRRPCAVAVETGKNPAAPHRALPVIAESRDVLESLALADGIPVIKLSQDTQNAVHQLSTYAPDIIIVSCFGRKLAEPLLSVPTIGCFNLHPSVLPAYRGPSPVFWQFRAGVKTMGVTLHRMTAQLDAGDIVAQAMVDIADGITLQQAGRLLAEAGSRLLVEALVRQGRSGWSGRAQQEGKAAYYGFPVNSDYAVSARWTAQRLYNFMRATRGQGIVYPCSVEGRLFNLVEAIGFRKTGAARLIVQDDEVTLPCCSGSVRARFLPDPL